MSVQASIRPPRAGASASDPATQLHLPWWTWILPLPIFCIASLLSLAFKIAPGIAVWYLPIPIGVVLINWWGPRVLLAMYLNAMIFAGFWDLPRMALWPVYSWPEVMEVALSWCFFTRLLKGRCWLPTPRDLYLFIIFAMTLPSIVSSLLIIPGQLVILGDLPATDAILAALSGWITDIMSYLVIAVPLLMFCTARMEKLGMARQRNAETPDIISADHRALPVLIEVTTLTIGLAFISHWTTIDKAWYAYGFAIVWVSARYEMGAVLLFNGIVVILTLLLPVFDTLGFSQSWIENGSLVTTNLGISVLCVSGLVIGRLVTSLKRESEIKLQRGLRMAGLVNWTFNPSAPQSPIGEYAYSPGISDLAGRSSAELAAMGDEFYDLTVHEEDRAGLKQLIDAFPTSADHAYSYDYRIIRPDGGIRYVRETAEKIFDADGRLVQVLGTLQDMTEIRQREMELIAAKNEAIAANRSKSEFLANMSHELRTPLNAIIGFSQIIHNQFFGPTDTRYVAYARDINASGDHLQKLITDILDLSKLEVGRYALVEETIDLREQIDLCLKMVVTRANEQHIALIVDWLPDLPLLLADERAFRQVLINLLSNAVKFTGRHGSVTVRPSVTADGLSVTISDTGIGIAPEIVPKLFAPFQMGNAHVSRNLGGSGLGLVISKQLMERHQGTIVVKSIIGRGTDMTITFPPSRIVSPPKSTTEMPSAAATPAK
ncbi:MAG TPA: ATP-binding protein [Terriglobales bacterium]|nr:ATP-binding protein [Terriglobales bacterium]